MKKIFPFLIITITVLMACRQNSNHLHTISTIVKTDKGLINHRDTIKNNKVYNVVQHIDKQDTIEYLNEIP